LSGKVPFDGARLSFEVRGLLLHSGSGTPLSSKAMELERQAQPRQRPYGGHEIMMDDDFSAGPFAKLATTGVRHG
jgi:hypothetical protein